MVKGWIVDFFRRSIGLHYRCSRCGRELHDKKSIRRGMGPECWKAYMQEVKGEVEWVSPSPTPSGGYFAEGDVVRDLESAMKEKLEEEK